jgi:hypothetical protein
VLASLGLTRADLRERYYRLDLMTAAGGGRPALAVPEWRTWVTNWLQAHSALLLVVDTATAATQVDPWGPEIQAVYRNLRAMLVDYPAVAIVLAVHVKKPTGRGERRISDVLGEWGRWCDVLVLQENDGASLTRTKLSVRKRVRHEQRFAATKAGGLLIDPQDLVVGGPKVGLDKVVAAIVATPGMTVRQLANALGVAASTAASYAAEAERIGRVARRRSGPKGQLTLYPVVPGPEAAGEAPSDLSSASDDPDGRIQDGRTVDHDRASFRPSDHPIGSEGSRSEEADPLAVACRIFGDSLTDEQRDAGIGDASEQAGLDQTSLPWDMEADPRPQGKGPA